MRNKMEVLRGRQFPMWNSFAEIDNFFEQAFHSPWTLMTKFEPTTGSLFQSNFEVDETDQAYLLTVDMPGVHKEDIHIDLNDRVLTVTGERRREPASKDNRRSERTFGKYQRSFSLPLTVDVEKVAANLENGVLTIALPKCEAAKPRSIEIQNEKSGFFSKLLGSDKKEVSTNTSQDN